eukprot:412964-Prorocentrum_minimum.AAC.1
MTSMHTDTLPSRLFHRRVSCSPADNDDSSDRIGGERGQDTMVKLDKEKVKQMDALQESLERYHSARASRFLPFDESDDDSSDCCSSGTGSVGDLEDSWTDEQ